MNAIIPPQPLSIDTDTVTIDRAAWDALLSQIEDAADIASIKANDARRAAIGDEAYQRECVTADEALRVLDGVSLITIYRERVGLTQRALADKAGVSPAYLNEVERGKKPGSAAGLKKLATALGVSIDALME